MSSFNNMTTIEPLMFRSTVGGDLWYPDAFARETESVLTKALQQSLLSHQQPAPTNQPILSSFLVKQPDYSSTAASISASASAWGSEPETPGSKPRGNTLGVSIAKSAKRKSRISKRSMTTFIQADPANFRQMVQQVTGVKLERNRQLGVNTLVKPKPKPLQEAFVNKLQGLLPTLDTSAYLLNNQNMNTHRISGSGSLGFSQPPAGDESDFVSFSSFPTLESSI